MAGTEHDEPDSKPRRQTYDRRAARTRRAGEERRRAERRRTHLGAPPGATPRKGDRRKRGDRRLVFDRRLYRRRDLPGPYTSEEVLRIQRSFQIPGHRGDCPACGARFILFASRRRGADMVRKVECRSCGKATVVTNSCCGRVLLVTGVAATRHDVRSLLSGAGHDVGEAGDADSALRAYRDTPADIVMVDMTPSGGLDGADVIRRLRAEFSDVVILAVAPRKTHGTGDPLAAARQLGATSILRAPFRTSDLLAAISTMIQPDIR